jgi:hypothetical protein
MPEPRSSEPIANEPSTLAEAKERGDRLAALAWADALDHLSRADGFWIATLDRAGAPRIRPVFAVVADGGIHTTSNPAAQKARSLEHDPRCAIGGHTPEFDLIVEGAANRVRDGDALERVAAAYRDRYGWPVTVAGDAFDAPFGAPTAGPPPYAVFRIEPSRAYAIGITDQTNHLSTRWRF